MQLPAAAGVRVQLCSYNLGQQSFLPTRPPDLASWLVPVLESDSKGGAAPPDIVVVGWQEFVPLHQGLLGITTDMLRLHASIIHRTLAKHLPSSSNSGEAAYVSVAQIAQVGLAFMVFARPDTARRVRSVQYAQVGTGFGGIGGNKGAVGIRFALRGEEADEVFTFVNAHLAPHDRNVSLRNANYASIVSRLLFQPAPGSKSDGASSIYDTTHLFVLGDLNYRLNLTAPRLLSRQMLAGLIADDRAALVEHDQLTQARRAGETMRGLREADVGAFRPTYKYEAESKDKLSQKRIPGWTDRILFTTASDSPSPTSFPLSPSDPSLLPSSSTRIHLYTSVPQITYSDHKPITLVLTLPAPSPAHTRLQTRAPVPPDPRASQKAWAGWALDRLVGALWCLLVLLGLGDEVKGAFGVLAGLGGAAWYYGGLGLLGRGAA